MAKKKAKKEPTDDLEEDLSDLEDNEIEIALPKIDKKIEKEAKEISFDIDDSSEEDYDEEFELEDEEKPEILDYKYVKLNIHKVLSENDYELDLIGQSHGLCNILVKYLLNTEGVKLAAYKITNIEPPKIFIRLKNGHKIKDILFKSIESLREEVLEVEKLFQKLI